MAAGSSLLLPSIKMTPAYPCSNAHDSPMRICALKRPGPVLTRTARTPA